MTDTRNPAVATLAAFFGMALLAMLLPDCLDGPNCDATIKVLVKDDQGLAIEGAVVTLDHECCTSWLEDNGKPRSSCNWRTGANGRVALGVDGVDMPSCTVFVDATGFQSATQGVSFTADNECSKIPLNFSLMPQ